VVPKNITLEIFQKSRTGLMSGPGRTPDSGGMSEDTIVPRRTISDVPFSLIFILSVSIYPTYPEILKLWRETECGANTHEQVKCRNKARVRGTALKTP
jgi:hypothetical protein